MCDEYGSDFISICDENGNEFELEIVGTVDYKGQTYYACYSTEPNAAGEEDLEMIILKSIIEDGEEYLSTPDTDEEAEEVYDHFMDILFDDEDEE